MGKYSKYGCHNTSSMQSVPIILARGERQMLVTSIAISHELNCIRILPRINLYFTQTSRARVQPTVLVPSVLIHITEDLGLPTLHCCSC